MFKDKNVLIAAAAGTFGGGLLVWGLTKLAAKFADKPTPAAIIKDPVVAKEQPAPTAAPTPHATQSRPTAEQDGSAEFYAAWQYATRIPYEMRYGALSALPLISEDFPQFAQGTQLSMMDPFGVKYLIVTGHRSVGNLVIREEYVNANLVLFQYLSQSAAFELNGARRARFLGVQFLHRAIGFLSTYVQPQAEGMTPRWMQLGTRHSSILRPHPLGYAREVISEENPVKEAFLEIWRASEPLPADTPDGRYTNLDQFGIPVLTKEYAPGKTLKWYNGRGGKAFTVVGNDNEENVVFCERPSTTYIGYSEDIVRFSDGETTVITGPATFDNVMMRMLELTKEEQQASESQETFQHEYRTIDCVFPADGYSQMQHLYIASQNIGTGLVSIADLVNWPMNKRPGFIARLEYGPEFQVLVIAGKPEQGNLVIYCTVPKVGGVSANATWSVVLSLQMLSDAEVRFDGDKLADPHQLTKLLRFYGFYHLGRP